MANRRDHLPPRAMAARISAVRLRAPPPGTGAFDRGAISSEATGTGLFDRSVPGMVNPLIDCQTDRGAT